MAAHKVGKRRSVQCLLLLIAMLTTILPSSPARASYYEHGISLTGQVVRDSVPYRLNIKAVQVRGGPRLDVSLSAVQDPVGATPVRQTQRWSFTLGEGEFSMQGDTYRIDARGEGSPFHVDLLAERKADSACSEGQPLFVSVPEGGDFRIETDNQVFGAITELPPCAEQYWFSSGPEPGPPQCPLRGQELWAQSLHLKERRSSDLARMLVFRTEPLDVAGRSGTWSVKLRGSVPASRFRLNERLVGSFDGTGLPWLDGVARFQPETAFERGQWYDCKGQREARTAAREGAIYGDLAVDVIGSRERSVNDSLAIASRSRVRRR